MFENCCGEGEHAADSIKFWFDFLDYIMRVIEDDKNIYTPVLNQFPQELNVGNISSASLWNLYKTDLKTLLLGKYRVFPWVILISSDHAKTKSCSTPEYSELIIGVQPMFFQWIFTSKSKASISNMWLTYLSIRIRFPSSQSKQSK
jgi:protein unc-13